MFMDIAQEAERPEREHWLPVAQAKDAGFRFLFQDDGDADVLAPDGEIFNVNGFKCTCTNHVYRTHCLHELWIRQLRPCDQCGSVMELSEYATCFGETVQYFQCPCCGNARDIDLVRAERSIKKKDSRLTPKGRCTQAIAWLRAKGSEWYIWQLMQHSPELVPAMVEALSEIDEHMLADRIIHKAGFRAA